jgi:hypothetical protein
VAIGKAAKRASRNNRTGKNRWLRSEITSFLPSKQYDVIMFRESIYYLSMKEIDRTLAKLKGFLNEGGVFIVRMYDRERCANIVSFVKRHYRVVEEYLAADSKTTVIVFR